MSDESPFPPPGGDRRWDDMPGAIQWRVLALEKDRDDHEVRLRSAETAMQKLDALNTIVEEIRADQKEANAGGWRNFWTAIIGIFTVIATILGTHYFK